MTLDGKTSTESCGIEIKGKYKWKIMFQNKVMFIFDTDFHMLMEYEQLCKNVFDMDKQIRFVAVYNSNIEKITGGMRKGIEPLLEEQIENLSIEQSFVRRDTRIKLRDWIGLPKYALVEYDKIKRFTFYLDSDKLLLVSTELVLDNDSLVANICQLIHNVPIQNT